MAKATTDQPHATAMEESFQALAGRLANAVQVISAWGDALSTESSLRDRLEQAAQQLDQAVQTLSAREQDPLCVRRSRSADALGLSGRSEMISLVEFLSFLSNFGKDGVLRVRAPMESFVLQVEQGDVTFASCGNPVGLQLREILVADGVLSEADLQRAVSECGEGELVAKAALRLRLIDMPALRSALTHQITQMFTRMHLVGTGFDFEFEEGARVMADSDIRLSISRLLLESARLKDELEMPTFRPRDEEPVAPTQPARDPASAPTGEATIEMFRRQVKKLVEGDSLVLPSLPDTTGQVLAMCGQPDIDTEQLWECVSRDQALCAHLLRIVNSAAQGLVQQISSIRTAITRLGVAKIREVALALALDQKVFRLPEWQDVIQSLWWTAAITSGFAGRIGRKSLTSSAHGSLLGLLQDIGKPIVLSLIHDVEKQTGKKLDRRSAEMLMEEFHEHAGVRLAEQWALPDWVTEVIQFHHCPENATDRQREAMVGNLAYELALWAQGPEQDVARIRSLPVCKELRVSDDDLRALLEDREAVLESAKVYS